MEFRLNKIDPEVRQKVKETTSSGKVHTKSGIAINKYSKDKNNGDSGEELEKQKTEQDKKKLLVDAVKVEEIEIAAFKESQKESISGDVKGSILDVRK